ncbi:MAG: beta-lactamase family protein [Clostridia bacterium]|nr:beta-lactamase family protein [Clostridia bacterium]
MKTRTRLSVAFLLALWLCFGAVNVFAAEQTENIGERIESYVSEHADTTAGMAVTVFDSEKELYTGCFGYTDREQGVKTDSQSVFEWGSTTKLLVWTSVMQLYEQGKIDLDADVRQYLPEGFLKNLRFDKPVTMTHLMNHSAGFQEMLWDVFLSTDEEEMMALGELLSHRQPEQVFEPGSVTAYSNWGVALAGYIVECIAGQPFYEYVNAHIFSPLGMKRTSLKPDYSDNPFVREAWDRLVCYTTDCQRLEPSRYYVPIYPAGSCVSTIGDYLIFAQALLNRESVLFAKPETHDLLFRPTSCYEGTDIPRNCHGMWMIPYGKPVYGHGGNTAGCSAYILLSPEENIGMAVMTNQSGEEIYNCRMPELLFGKFDESDYFGEKRELPTGLYKSARSVFTGPIKLYSIAPLRYDEEDRQEFWIWDKESGVVRAPYGDCLSVPTWQVFYELGIVGLWAISVVMAPVMLIVMLICRLRRGESRPMGRWAAIAMLLRLAIVGMAAYIVYSGLTYRPSDAYFWGFAVIAGLAVVLTALAVVGIVGLSRNGASMKKGTKFVRIMTLCGMIITLVNVLYWNIFVFWA